MQAGERPLEPSRATLERWLDVFGRAALDASAALAASPGAGPLGAAADAVAAEVSRPIGEDPLPGGAEEAARLVLRAAEVGLVPAAPGYLAYVPGTGLFATALADLLSDTLDRFTGLRAAAPALCRLEADVVAWLARECGFDERAAGVLLSGGSIANLVGVVTAREERLGPAADLRTAVAYTTGEAHHCVAKALRLAAIPPANLRRVPHDEAFRMDPGALARLVAEDRATGLRPFLVVASAGTTNTGAVDPLEAVADVCAAEGLWLHVDGAYGAAFVLCAEGRATLRGLGRADSLAFDPHKGLFLPFGTGLLLARDGAALRRTHASGAHYLQDFDGDVAPAPGPNEVGPELSRSYRGLRLWLPLMLHGARAFRDALAEKLALAREAHAAVLARAREGAPLEVVAAPQLSTFAFRLRRRALEPLAAWNARNARLHDAVNAEGRVHLSSTALPVADGTAFTLRVCVLGARTHEEHVRAFVAALDAALARESPPGYSESSPFR